MKKQILITSAIILCISFFLTSCDKKKSMDMSTIDITMNYTPNPVKKDSLISFNFDVMKSGVLQAVTSTSCEVIIGSSTNTMATTEQSAGKYTGKYTFTATGNYALHFKYTLDGMASDKDFALTVQ